MPTHRFTRPARWRALAIPAALIAIGAGAPAALADSTVSIQTGPIGSGLSGRHVLIAASPTLLANQPLDVNAQIAGPNVSVTDAAGTVRAGAGCSKVGATVLCPAGGLSALKYVGSRLNDRMVNSTAFTSVMLGGLGNDELHGGAARDFLNGEDGNDTEFGGAGPDVFVSERGGDRLDGQSGFDTVNYSAATAPVTVRMDDLAANDGQILEGDRVLDMEGVTGSRFDDVLVGSNTTADVLSGGLGRDILRGLAGDDRLDGGAGPDDLGGGIGRDLASYAARTTPVTVTLDSLPGDGEAGENDNVRNDVEIVAGGSAADTLTGNAFSNLLIGNGGDDKLDPRGGVDQVSAGAGDDRVFIRDGVKDTPVTCGTGVDIAVIDSALDRTNALGAPQLGDCEALATS